MSYQLLDAGEGGRFTGTCRDANGDPIPKAAVTAFTVTATNAADATIINGRNAQNVLDANDGSMDPTSGAFAFNIQPEDTELVDPEADSEEHTFAFRCVGNFPGEVLEFQHHVRCVETLLLCRFDQVQLHLAELDESQEPLVHLQIEAFTKLVEQMTGRVLRRKTVTEVCSPCEGAWTVRLSRWPIHSITSVKEALDGDFDNATALDPEAYVIGPEGIVRRRWVAFLGGPGSVQVVYDGGLARSTGACPADLRQAAAMHVAQAWQNRTSVSELELSDYVKRVIATYGPRIAL